MILPTSLLLGTLVYLFYISKKELSLGHDASAKKTKENDDLYEELKDIFI